MRSKHLKIDLQIYSNDVSFEQPNLRLVHFTNTDWDLKNKECVV